MGCPPRERKRLTLAGTYLQRRGDDVPWVQKEMTHLVTEEKRRTLVIERNGRTLDMQQNDVPWLLNETTHLGSKTKRRTLEQKRHDVPWLLNEMTHLGK